MVLWYTLTMLSPGKGIDMFTENTVWKAVERLINANADFDSDGLSPYESILIRFLLRGDRDGRPISKQVLL